MYCRVSSMIRGSSSFSGRLCDATTAQELYDKMLELYPNRVNPGWALWGSARAVKS